MKTPQAIGPVEVHSDLPDQKLLHEQEAPFTVDHKDPRVHELAKQIGWQRVYAIQAEEQKAHREAREL